MSRWWLDFFLPGQHLPCRSSHRTGSLALARPPRWLLGCRARHCPQVSVQMASISPKDGSKNQQRSKEVDPKMVLLIYFIYFFIYLFLDIKTYIYIPKDDCAVLINDQLLSIWRGPWTARTRKLGRQLPKPDCTWLGKSSWRCKIEEFPIQRHINH